jgi:hypothetical protein
MWCYKRPLRPKRRAALAYEEKVAFMASLTYLERGVLTLAMRRGDGDVVAVPSPIFRRAIDVAHDVVDKFRDFGVDVFSILGLRNLSAFVGELYAAAAVKSSNGLFRKNPHQDGIPDLLIMDDAGAALWQRLEGRLREKAPFSPFATGGIEVKATCGSLPTPAVCQRRGFEKPDIGDQRIGCMVGYDWKAHHRETNNLIGLLWDFIEGTPRIVAVFYSSELTASDWGKIVKPKAHGGRTTSVSIMNGQGIRRMYGGWLFVLADERYTHFIDGYNQSDELARALKRSG